MKKRFLSFLIVMCMFLINIPVNATCSAGINGNGTGGIYIDINSAPYTTFAGYSYGEYAYTSQGCAWFASARVNQLTGKGNVIRRMFREIDAECYLMIDGDDTYPLDCAQEMVDRVLQHQADMVVGDRLSSTYFTENKRPFHNFGNSLMRAGINSLFHANIKDIMTGYRAFSYEFVKTFPVFSKGFEIETEMTIHAVNYNMQVENVVVEYRDRPQGSESKLNTYSDGFRVIRKMMQLYKNYKPLHFFGMLALLLIAVSVILFVPVFLEYLNTGLVPRFPTLIACGFILLAGIQSFFAGMMLEVMAAKDRKDFEYRLNRVHGEHQVRKGL